MKGGEIVVTLKNNFLTVQINKLGAELSSVIDNKTNYEFIWQADEKYWGKHAPVLFPIVGRLKDDQYEYDGKTYEMTQHGFGRDSDFEVIDQTANAVTFSLKYSTDTLKKYPFKFELLIKYLLHKNNLTVYYEVINHSSSEVMYYSVGGHPGFNVAQTSDSKDSPEFDDVFFHMEPQKSYRSIPLTDEGLLKLNEAKDKQTERIQLTHNTFKNDALIYQIDTQAEMILEDQSNQVEIRLKPNHMKYVGVWSPFPAQAGFVCLEPWAGIADQEGASGHYNEKYAINELAANEKMIHDYTISFTKKAQL